MNIKKEFFIGIIAATAIVSVGLTIGVQTIISSGLFSDSIIILSDKRCKKCNAGMLETRLKRVFPGSSFKVYDYSDSSGKKLYENEKVKFLPAVLLPKSIKSSKSFRRVARFVKPGKDYLKLKTRGTFDPKGEICDNGKDDDGNKLVDCQDPTCKTNWKCMEKKDKPDVDVFVMSHCPYGTQIEKGILPVWKLLDKKVNLNVRFCDYIMHGKKEIDEQLVQYCIQKKSKKKYMSYLECFLKEGKSDNCLSKTGISKSMVKSCVKATDRKFSVSKDFKNKATYKGRFPKFKVDGELVKKYGISGSPALVINNVKAQSGRSPKQLLDAICQGFKVKPKECSQKLSAKAPRPGFDKGKKPRKRMPMRKIMKKK
ncbi:hypothetical protein ACFL20_11510 [Spirochaetota bacterium]